MQCMEAAKSVSRAPWQIPCRQKGKGFAAALRGLYKATLGICRPSDQSTPYIEYDNAGEDVQSIDAQAPRAF